MSHTKVSVIIPAFRQAQFLREAIQSVLEQSYTNFELIVVDDASPDPTAAVVSEFQDGRLQYIVHKTNRGLPAARNTGIRASSGKFIALLDADDLFHPEKLAKHVAFLERDLSVGASYNARFDFIDSRDSISAIWCPPRTVGLLDLVQGFPFAPSDMVIRREWLFNVGLFDESYVFFSEDLDINCRLALAGCQFAGIDRALNYRRYHSDRVIGHLTEREEAAIRAQESAFADPRCPPSVQAVRAAALAGTYLIWSYLAFLQDDTASGQRSIRLALDCAPFLLEGTPCPLVELFVRKAALDASLDYEKDLKRIWAQLPPNLRLSAEEYLWALGEGVLLRAAHTIMWKGKRSATAYIARAVELEAVPSKALLQKTAHDLLSFEREFGSEKAEAALDNMVSAFSEIGYPKKGRWLRSCYTINSAFEGYHSARQNDVPRKVIRAVLDQPAYIKDRGVWSILLRSILGGRLANGRHG